MRYKNLAEMFFQTTSKYGDRTAFQYKDGGAYQPISYNEANKRVHQIAAGLVALGVKKGDKVALLSENRWEWAFSDYAIVALGAVNVPIYPSLLSDQVKYIINDSEASVILCSNDDQYQKVAAVRAECRTLKSVIVIDKEQSNDYLTFDQLRAKGDEYLAGNPDYLEKQIATVETDDLATIIYTSGTTGEPKGAMLTHGNFLSNIEGSLQHLDVDENDLFLSFLPLCHVFERMAGHYLSMYSGAGVAYAESIDTVAANMGEVHPTVMTSVPRLYEKIYARILESVENGSGLKRKIFYWAIGVGREYINTVMYNKPVSGGLQFKRNLAHKLVYRKLAERVGGKLRFFVSGGAPLSREIAEFFGAAGLLIFEGYGLTETSPVIAVNSSRAYRFGTVGPVIPNVEVKIAEDGEILTRGPHVMKGYFKKEDATKEAIDGENWFHTGDIGMIDDDGFLAITDRKKNILVTSGGKNIAPAPIENQLITSKFIEQAMVIGDQRRFCSAVIVASLEALEAWAKEKGIAYESHKDLIEKPEVKNLYRAEVDRVNEDLARYEAIKEFVLTERQFTIESGEITPTLKVKRKVVIENYRDAIEEIYKE